MISTGMIALASKTIFTGINFGTANQLACATLSQFNTHAFVYSTPSAFTAVVGSTTPMIPAMIYPAIIPINTEEALVIPFVPCFNAMMITRTIVPSNKFSIDPKSLAEFPPPKELTPTPISDNPMESTTVPVTTAGKNLRSGFNINPNTDSNNPPIMEAPMIAPYPRIPPPMTPATLLQTPINPELVPMMIGTFPPIGPIAYNWIRVTIPAINIAFCKSAI